MSCANQHFCFSSVPCGLPCGFTCSERYVNFARQNLARVQTSKNATGVTLATWSEVN